VFLFSSADAFSAFLFQLQVSLHFVGVGYLSCCFLQVCVSFSA